MKKHILVIEDEVNIRDTICDILELKGFHVTSAQDGQEGFFSVIKENPDLVLCDIMMPKMNGYEVLEAVRSYMKTSSIPFVFLTAKDNPGNFREGMDLGADDYLVKPVNSQKLYEVICYRLQKHQSLLEAGRRTENKRVSKDLHDTLQQTLLGLKMQIQKTVELAITDKMKVETSKSLDYINVAISQLRLILESRAENTGEDLCKRVKEMTERLVGYINFQIRIENHLDEIVIGEKADRVFKAIQEVINNTIKHSKARNLDIIFSKEDTSYKVQISDNGVGFDVKALKHRRGLSNIEDRLKKAGGKVELCSATGQGTSIILLF